MLGASVGAAAGSEQQRADAPPIMAEGDVAHPIDRGWSRTVIDEQPALYSGTYLVAHGGDGFVIIGEGGTGCCWSSVETWSSPDGRAWSEGTQPAAFMEASARDPATMHFAAPGHVVPWRDGFIAAGSECCSVGGVAGARISLSADGVRWETVPAPEDVFGSSTMSTIVVAHGRVVVAGADEVESKGSTGAVAWASTDGRTWQRTSRTASPFAPYVTIGLTEAADGFLAWPAFVPGHGEGGASLWRSLDGIAWEKIDTGGIFRDVSIDRVIFVHGRLIALAARECRTRVLVSDDATTWREVESPAAAANAVTEATWPCRSAITAVAAGDAGVLAIGATHSQGAPPRAMLWFSPNGERWHRVQTADAFTDTKWGEIELGGVTAIPGGFLVVGGIPLEPGNKPNTAPAVWMWSAPATGPQPTPPHSTATHAAVKSPESPAADAAAGSVHARGRSGS